MNFLYDFDHFVYSHPGKQIGVFLHTSVVQESFENLKRFIWLKKGNVTAYISENCVSELKLLSKYSSFAKYREKAAFLLENCSTFNAWSYRNIVSYKNTFQSSYHCEIALFVFYEPSAAADFSLKMGKQRDVFVLSYDPYNTNRVCNYALPVGTVIPRTCRPLNNSPSKVPYKPEDILIVQNRNRQKISELKMADLKMFHGGGEALLFTAPSMPGKILKVYKFSPGENMVNKLRLLITFSSLFSGCVLPTELLFLRGKCVGYIMSQVYGDDLGCVLPDYSEAQRKPLIRDISVLLLEMRMAQFVVTDLSTGNIHVGKDGKIRIIDCDSMQFYEYPGGGVTPPYGHPDVTDVFFYNRLRTDDHINFSYAVLLFEILLGWKNPLIQKGLGDTDPVWRKNKFPYTNIDGRGAAAKGVRANEEKLQKWCQQPLPIREGFENVFTFQTTYDIGEWVQKLGIV